MAAKSIINELYQRLRTAAPVYKTQADSDGFSCTLTLPAVECDWEGLHTDRHLQGRGSSKKEAEHAAAIAAVDLLTAVKVLRPEGTNASHSRKTSTASPSVSSATSGASLSGSKRCTSNVESVDDESEGIEIRILDALLAAYPRSLNAAQLAKLCGHFKLKPKVNHLLYMRLKAQGLVELIDTHTPTWRAAKKALQSNQAETPVHTAATCSTSAQPSTPGDVDDACSPATASGLLTAAAQHTSNENLTPSSRLIKCASQATTLQGEPAHGSRAACMLAGAASGATPLSGHAAEQECMNADSSSGADVARTPIAVAYGMHMQSSMLKRGACCSPAQLASKAGGARWHFSSPSPAELTSISRPQNAATGQNVKHLGTPAAAAAHAMMPCVQQHVGQDSPVLDSECVQPCAQHTDSSSSKAVRHLAQSCSPANGLQQQQQQHHMLQQQTWTEGPAHMQPLETCSQGHRHNFINSSAQLEQKQQSWLQNTLLATGVETSTSLGWQQELPTAPAQQQYAPGDFTASLDALLLPQTLAAVAGLGLFDATDAELLPAVASASDVAADVGAVPTRTQLQQHQQHRKHLQTPLSGASPPEPADGYGHICSNQQQQHCAVSQLQAPVHSCSLGDDALERGCSHSLSAKQQPVCIPAALSNSLRQLQAAGSDSDEEVSPAVLAAVSEAASLEPAPVRSPSTPHGSVSQQQQQQQTFRHHQQQEPLCVVQQPYPTHLQFRGMLLQHVDLLAAMHIHEHAGGVLSHPQQQQQHIHEHAESVLSHAQQQQHSPGPCTGDAVVPDSSMRLRVSSGRAPGEAGTKRKYPAYLSTEAATVEPDATPAEATADAAHPVIVLDVKGAGLHERGSGACAGTGLTQHSHAPTQQQEQQEQPHQVSVSDNEPVHPQRRRRRSGQSEGFSGRGFCAGRAAAHGAAAAAVGCPGEDEYTGSSDDMHELDECGNGGSCAGVTASASVQGCPELKPSGNLHLCQDNCWQEQLPGQQHASGGTALAAVPEPARVAASTRAVNPWQWQGMQQAWQQQGQLLAGHQQCFSHAAYADSEGNGSCLDWTSGGDAAAANAGNQVIGTKQQPQHADDAAWRQPLHAASHTEQQHRKSFSRHAFAIDCGRACSPGPCVSGLSVGASGVSGGVIRRSEEPLQAAAEPAAVGQDVAQSPMQSLSAQAARTQQAMQVEQQNTDWKQSEEQAVQLLSRLALPQAAAQVASSSTARCSRDVESTPSGLPDCAALTDTASLQAPGDCLTVAMAAAAAAAKAAAAVATAAGLASASSQQCGLKAPACATLQKPAGNAGMRPEDTLCGLDQDGDLGSDPVAGAAGPPGAAGGCRGAAQGAAAAQADTAAPSSPGLQAEYERRVGAVRDLVQQLNAALQGLNDLQDQVSKPAAAGRQRL